MKAASPVYDSSRRSFRIVDEFVELWQYRGLLGQMILRNVKTRYKRSLLGVGWTLLNPLLVMAVLSLVFSELFKTLNVEHYPVYLLSGLVLWNFFAQSVMASMNELVWGSNLIKRIYVPRSIFAVAAVGTGLVNMLLAIIPLFIVMLAMGHRFTSALFFLPIAVLSSCLFVLGMALLLSTIAVFFTDVIDMFQVVLTLWMYVTPVMYPKELILGRSESYAKLILDLNPMYHLLEVFRAPIYLGWVSGYKTLLVATGSSLAVFVVGWIVFSLKSDHFAYRV
jgi:ABC-2 type transport system permease protein